MSFWRSVALVLLPIVLGAQPLSPKESALAQKIAQEMRRHTTALEDAAVLNYVESLGRRLASAMPADNVTFTFNVIADDLCLLTHEPRGLFGGNVFVPARLFAEAHNEAEFAAMLAHSMQHAAEHPRRYNSAVPVYFAMGCGENPAVPAALVDETRQGELEADRTALEMLAATGMDPAALVSYIGRVQPEGTHKFSVLPDREKRLEAMNRVVARLPRQDYANDSSEFLSIQQRVAELAVQRPERSGPPTLRRQ